MIVNEFWQEGLTTFMRNIRDLLLIAGEPVNFQTMGAVAKDVAILERPLDGEAWKKTFTHHCFLKADAAKNRHAELSAHCVELADYFLKCFVDHSNHAKHTLIDSVLIVLREAEAAMKAERIQVDD